MFDVSLKWELAVKVNSQVTNLSWGTDLDAIVTILLLGNVKLVGNWLLLAVLWEWLPWLAFIMVTWRYPRW